MKIVVLRSFLWLWRKKLEEDILGIDVAAVVHGKPAKLQSGMMGLFTWSKRIQ